MGSDPDAQHVSLRMNLDAAPSPPFLRASAVSSLPLLDPPAESLRAVATAPTSDLFVDLLDANFNKPTTKPPAKGLTENASPTFISSGDPCLDFFFHVVPGTPTASVSSLLSSAWAAELNTVLRLACNLRGVRGTGKSDREGFYAAVLWMHDCHPAMLALNARPVAEFGYLKDLPELLHRIVHGGVSTRTPGKKDRLAAEGGFMVRGRFHSSKPRRVGKGNRRVGTSEARVVASLESDRKISAKAAVERRKRHAEAAEDETARRSATVAEEGKGVAELARRGGDGARAEKWRRQHGAEIRAE